MSGLYDMQYHCNTCDSMLVIGCSTCNDRRKIKPGRKRSVDSSDWTDTPETTASSDGESIYEIESESEDGNSNIDLSELEEIDETEVLDIITDKERFEIAEEALQIAIDLGKKYRIK